MYTKKSVKLIYFLVMSFLAYGGGLAYAGGLAYGCGLANGDGLANGGNPA